MHEARQNFCLDLFSMCHKIGSCSTLYFCLVMQITVQYFIWKVPCLIRTLIFEVKFEGKKEHIKLLYTGKYGYYETTSLSISFFHYWSNTPITNCKVCRLRRPQECVCSKKQTLDFVFIPPSCTPRQRFMPNELLLFTYRFPQTSQQNQRKLQPKADKALFKVQIRIKFLARHSGEKRVIFQIFCFPKQNPVAIDDRASVISIPVSAALAFPLLAFTSSSVPPLVITILPRYVNNETFSMAPFSNIMELLLVVTGLINKGWYSMFFACGIWCVADVSSVSPSSEQILIDFVIPMPAERPKFPADSSIWVVFSCIWLWLCASKVTSSAKSKSSNWFHSVHWIPFLCPSVLSLVIQSTASRNKKGGSKQPCLTPVFTSNLSVRLPSCYNLRDIPS